MLDIETLGTSPSTVVLSVGAVKFDPFSKQDPGPGFYMKLNVDQQIARERTVDQATLDWWQQQPAEVRQEALSDDDRVDLDQFYKEFNRFLVGARDIWAQGPVFDIVILENLYRSMSWPTPWNFWQIRDSRTLFSVHGDPRDKNRSSLHNALADAVDQALAVQQVYHDLNIKKPG